MSDRTRGGKRWYHYLGAGCAGALLLVVITLTLLVLFARGQAGSRNVATRTLERELPVAKAPDEPATGVASPRGSLADGVRLPPLAPLGAAQGLQPGRVTLELSNGEFRVRPAGPGEPLHVEARYDLETYELTDRLDEHGEDGWAYQVRFRQKAQLGLMQILGRILSGGGEKVTVFLPRDVPMALDLRVSQGGGQVDLGGLWLTKAEVKFTQGGGDLAFSEPLRRPTEHLTIDSSMGGGSFRQLGNASPQRLEITSQMGGADVDLSGQWLQDCEISVDSRMGGLQIRLPREVSLRGLSRWGKDREVEGLPEAAPILSFSISSEMGDVNVTD